MIVYCFRVEDLLRTLRIIYRQVVLQSRYLQTQPFIHAWFMRVVQPTGPCLVTHCTRGVPVRDLDRRASH